MAHPVPKNVAAVLGLVPTALGAARRLPTKAVQLPVIAISSALSGLDLAKREYDELADRGETLIARLRGRSVNQVDDLVEAAVTRPPVVVHEAPSAGRVDSAASPDVVEQVEKIAAEVDAPPITDHSDLPLPDYDHMTLGSLRGRLRSLDLPQLVQLRDYEKSKAHRLPVVTMLDNRIAKLASGDSVPTGAAVPEATMAKPPKTLGTAAAAQNASPSRTKVRIT